MKKSVFLSETTVEFLSLVAKNNADLDVIQWSGGINGSILALKNIIRESMPDLTEQEWNMLLNVYNGSFEPAFSPGALYISGCMMDDRGEISIETLRNADPDYAELIEKVHGMNAAEQYAILFVCQAFWANSTKLNDVLQKLGNKEIK